MIRLSGIVANLPEHEYHASPELSSSGVRLMLPEYRGSLRKFQWAQSRPRTSRAFDLGHAVHAKVLGVGLGIVTYPDDHLTPAGNPSTRAATVEWESAQRSAGFTIVSPSDLARADAMTEAVLAHPTACLYLEVAQQREVSVFAEVDGVPCRARFDALSGETRNGVYAVDLKTAEDATVSGFTHSVKKWGYDVQEAHYGDVYEAATGAGIDDFHFVVVEKAAPYEVAVFQLTEQWVDMGRAKAAAARRLFAEATASGVWPGYDTAPTFLAPPAWAVIEHELDYEYGEIKV